MEGRRGSTGSHATTAYSSEGQDQTQATRHQLVIPGRTHVHHGGAVAHRKEDAAWSVLLYPTAPGHF